MTLLIVKTTLLLAAAALACILLRRRSAALRHGVWTAAMAAVLLAPLAPQPQRMAVEAPPTFVIATAIAEEPVSGGGDGAPIPWAAVVWALGSAVAASAYAAGLIALFRISAGARDFRHFEGIPVRTSPRVAIPCTWGLFRPCILLPESARGWDAARLQMILLHEAIHVRRFDWAAHILAQAACALYWFHPLVWYAARQMRHERERACDDGVLRAGTPAIRYAEHLLDLTRSAAQTRQFPAAGVGMWDFRQLEARMKWLLDGTQSRRAPGRLAWLALLAATLATAVPVALLSLHAQAGGALRGVIQDASGARVPEAIVMLQSANKKEITYSAADGTYAFPPLPPGAYTLTVLNRGFARWEKPVQVSAEGATTDVTLELGRIQETMEITGSRPKRPAAAQPASGAPQRIRVGGNVQPTRLLVHVKPSYPEELQELGVEGTVLLDAVIGTDGRLLSLRPANSQVHPGLVKAAMDAVGQWRYQPTLLNGQPVEVITTITVRYRLPSN